MQVVAHDLDVGTFFSQVLPCGLLYGVAEGIVLVEQVDLLDFLAARHPAGQRLHLHVGVRVEAKVPERAFLVGERRVDRRIVQEQDLLAGTPFVVAVHGLDQRACHRRAVALGDVLDALVDDPLQLVERLLRTGLVVKADDFELAPAEHAAGRVDPLDREAEFGESLLADVGKRPGQGIDVGDLDRAARGTLGLGVQAKGDCGQGGAEGGRAYEAFHCLLLMVWGSVLVGDLQHCFAAGRCFPMRVMVVKPGGRVKPSAGRAGLYLFFPKAALKTVIEETA